MRVLLRDLTPGQDYLMQFRSNNGTDVSPWSPIYNFRTNGDAIAPSNPGSLTWVPTGESFVGSWTAPTLDGPDVNGVQKALKDFKDYEVTVEANGKTKVYYTVNTAFEFTLVMNQEAFGGIELTVKITVRSRDFTGNKSSGVTLTATEDTPPTPSTPVVTNVLGQLFVTWDGLTSLGSINPFNLQYIEIHASTVNNFTPTDATKVARFEGWTGGKQSLVVSGLTYGAVNYFKLVSVNKKGKKSPPSAQASGTPTRLTGLDIDANGNLSASQMNFTARGLGGANSFYGTTLPTGTAAPDGTAYKSGDVFYNTAAPPTVNAGKTYRYNGSTWVEDTNIGTISGSKILAGTLTAGAVGTNLLITSQANIGQAVIDAANIASVNAATITTGTMKSSMTANYNGVNLPLWSIDLTGRATFNEALIYGQLVVGNSNSTVVGDNSKAQIRSYNYLPNTAGWTINGDGTVEFGSATLRGSFRTATTGRRIEVGTAGLTGSIRFYAPDGTVSSLTSNTGDLINVGDEFIRLGVDAPAGSTYHGVWNSLQIQETGEMFLVGKDISFMCGGAPGVDGSVKIWWAKDKGTNSTGTAPDTEIRAEFSELTNHFFHRGQTGFFYVPNDTADPTTRLYMDDDTTWHYQGAQGSTLFKQYAFGDPSNEAAASNRFRIGPGYSIFEFQGDVGYVNIEPNPATTAGSPHIQFMNKDGFGVAVYGVSSVAAGARFEVRNGPNNAFAPVWASAFTVSSSREVKEDIVPLGAGSLAKVEAMKPKKYRRKADETDRTEIGFIAQEMPEGIRSGEDGDMIDVMAMLTTLTAAVQELSAEVKKYKKDK